MKKTTLSLICILLRLTFIVSLLTLVAFGIGQDMTKCYISFAICFISLISYIIIESKTGINEEVALYKIRRDIESGKF